MPNIQKKLLFSEICAILASMKGFDFTDRNFEGFFPGKEDLKNHFLTAVAKVAAQSRLVWLGTNDDTTPEIGGHE